MAETSVPNRVTIREVAKEAGVSIATVSRVLNDREDVSARTREIVARVIRERGYTANRSARHLSGGSTGLIGVLVPLLYPAYFSGIVSGAAEALHEQDLRLVLKPLSNASRHGHGGDRLDHHRPVLQQVPGQPGFNTLAALQQLCRLEAAAQN